MARLAHNQVIRVESANCSGFFRVLATHCGEVALYLIDPLKPREAPKQGKAKDATPRIPYSFAARLSWHQEDELLRLRNRGQLREVEVRCASAEQHEDAPLNRADKAYFDKAVQATERLRDALVIKKLLVGGRGALGKVVREIMEEHGVARCTVYEWLHRMCAWGFTTAALRPMSKRRGAPGKPRPWGAQAGRLKPGRKTNGERAAFAAGELLPRAAGWTRRQELMVISKFRLHGGPGKSLASIHPKIIADVFATEFEEKEGDLIPIMPAMGTYPNVRATQRLISNHLGLVRRRAMQTTPGHFANNMRGSTSRAFRGIAGPGVQYGIDATRGDVYLRSSINRAWFIGRPIVYLIVDAWSTAIVGLHVCLTGPSWSMAKLGLFSAVAPPSLVEEALQLPFDLGLNPAPRLPYILVADRGEVFSQGGKTVAQRFGMTLKITPAYMPRTKGWVETVHRIPKAVTYGFVFGAVNARRKEFDLRNFHPASAVMTLREYFLYLILAAMEYNLTADRRPRLTTEMIATGAYPSPGGIWSWGHAMGLGYAKHIDNDQLLTNLLISAPLRITRSGALVGKLLYDHPVLREDEWVTRAALTGTHHLDAFIHPTSLANLWVPDSARSCVHNFKLSLDATAKPEESLDEVLDAQNIATHRNAEHEHERTLKAAEIGARRRAVHQAAVEATREADGSADKDRPPVREARRLEAAGSLEAQDAGVPDAQGKAGGDAAAGSDYGAHAYESYVDTTLARMFDEQDQQAAA